MRLQAFQALNKERQIEVIKSKGAFLYLRQQHGLDIILYQIDGFYAEVFFDGENGNGTHIKSFEGTEPLDVYLKEVSLADLEHLF